MVTTTPAGRSAPATPAPPPAPSGRRERLPRLYVLDGLRFAAAAGVVLHHFTARWHRGWGEDPGERFPVLGHVATYFSLAPELFFVISGFVILWTAWGRSVPNVIASRAARIYPAYWTALALTSMLLLGIWRDGKQISPGEVAVNATLLQSAFGVRHVDGVYWTLWAELRFYVLIVLLVAIGLTRRRVIAFAALWPLAAWGAQEAGWQVLTTVLVAPQAPFFAGGMLLFLMFRDGHSRGLWALVVGNVALAVHHTVPDEVASLTANTVFTPDPRLLGVLVVGCFATVALLTLTPLARVEVRPFLALGAITYPLYLVHEYWGWWVIDRLDPHLPTYVTLAAAVVVSVALALLVHHGVEKRLNPPMRRWLERTLSRTSREESTRARRTRPGRARHDLARPLPRRAPAPQH